MKECVKIKSWLLLIFSTCLHNKLNSIKSTDFKIGDSSSWQEMDGCFFQQILRQIETDGFWHRKTLPCKGFILKHIERPYVPLKNGTSNV